MFDFTVVCILQLLPTVDWPLYLREVKLFLPSAIQGPVTEWGFLSCGRTRFLNGCARISGTDPVSNWLMYAAKCSPLATLTAGDTLLATDWRNGVTTFCWGARLEFETNASHQGEQGSIRRGIAPGFWHVRIALDDVGRRVFSGFSSFPRPCIMGLLHTHLTSPPSALKTSLPRVKSNRPEGTAAIFVYTMNPDAILVYIVDTADTFVYITEPDRLDNLHYILLLPWRRGGQAISTLASHQGEPGSIPGRVTGFSHVGIAPDDAVGRRCSVLTLIILIGSQDLAVKSRPNLFTHSDWHLGYPAGETGDPRENPPTNGIVLHYSRMRKSGVTLSGIEPGPPWREASRLAAQPPWPHCSKLLTTSKIFAPHGVRYSIATRGLAHTRRAPQLTPVASKLSARRSHRGLNSLEDSPSPESQCERKGATNQNVTAEIENTEGEELASCDGIVAAKRTFENGRGLATLLLSASTSPRAGRVNEDDAKQRARDMLTKYARAQ
ncbi:hypothetical protein PR048_016934 [Dryococelus australis]|uniref:Uncharacterized protein n=1 Tax=Dryococelus australis TaxID=614101 RepID=A0ABQ9H834_9NEOP|nr:hypothetical protein PR048_016934 [Dryococelus australis]